MNIAFLFVAVTEVVAMSPNGDELGGKWKAKGFSSDTDSLYFTRFDTPSRLLNRFVLRGKMPPVVTGGLPFLTGQADCP